MRVPTETEALKDGKPAIHAHGLGAEIDEIEDQIDRSE